MHAHGGTALVMCTRCPTPCQKCRAGGNGPYCENTPCVCVCHTQHWQYREYRSRYGGQHLPAEDPTVQVRRSLMLLVRGNINDQLRRPGLHRVKRQELTHLLLEVDNALKSEGP